MAQVTAVVKLDSKVQVPNMDQYSLHFTADYKDERNKEWAPYTPSLAVQMTVDGRVSPHFTQGETYVLTFEKRED